ncbi:hypothetical protein ASF69_10135 [Rhizobium sp. Leaf311]|nr:hypothetical protein ASF69_10135 [Rhizobium sp. Leaf311]
MVLAQQTVRVTDRGLDYAQAMGWMENTRLANHIPQHSSSENNGAGTRNILVRQKTGRGGYSRALQRFRPDRM